MKRGVINNTNKSAINRRDIVKEKILKLILSSFKPLSTQEIADTISSPWHSVQNRCLQLQIENKLIGFRVGRMNLWQKK